MTARRTTAGDADLAPDFPDATDHPPDPDHADDLEETKLNAGRLGLICAGANRPTDRRGWPITSTEFKTFIGLLLSTVPSGVIPVADAFLAVCRQKHLGRQMDKGGTKQTPKEDPECCMTSQCSMRSPDLIA